MITTIHVKLWLYLESLWNDWWDSITIFQNGKPASDDSNIFLGVTDDSGIVFSTTVIAYPKPYYALLYENGAKTHDFLDSIKVIAINNLLFI